MFLKVTFKTHMPIWIIMKLNSLKCSPVFRDTFPWYSCASAILFHVNGLYQISCASSSGMLQFNTKVGSAYVIIAVAILILWYSLVKEKTNLCRLMTLMKSLQIKRNLYPNNNILACKCILASIYIGPVLFAGLFLYLSGGRGEFVVYWTYGIPVENAIHRSVLILIGYYAYFAFFTGYPSLIVLSMCLLMHRCKCILSAYNDQLKSFNFKVNNSDSLKDYFCAVEMVRLLRNALSAPLLLAMMISIFNMFITLSTCIQYTNVSFVLTLEMVITSLTGIVILCSLILYGARIPEFLAKIRDTAGTLLVENAKYKLQYVDGNESMYLLRRIEKSEISHLSACGIIKIKKNVLLSAIGSLFTYGLLILNLKAKDSPAI